MGIDIYFDCKAFMYLNRLHVVCGRCFFAAPLALAIADPGSVYFLIFYFVFFVTPFPTDIHDSFISLLFTSHSNHRLFFFYFLVEFDSVDGFFCCVALCALSTSVSLFYCPDISPSLGLV